MVPAESAAKANLRKGLFHIYYFQPAVLALLLVGKGCGRG